MGTREDDERASRIIEHMNKQHSRELTHFLLHQHPSLPQKHASPAVLKALFFTHMEIVDAKLDRHKVVFDPPLASWEDARHRLTEMDAEARRHLGLSDVFLDVYLSPRAGTEALVFGAVAFYFLCFATLPLVTPGSRLFPLLNAYWPAPRGALAYRWLVKALFWPVIGIHVTEAVLLDRWRMKPYGVERFSRLWWMWEVSCFIEGFGAFKRTKAAVDMKRAEKEKASKRH